MTLLKQVLTTFAGAITGAAILLSVLMLLPQIGEPVADAAVAVAEIAAR